MNHLLYQPKKMEVMAKDPGKDPKDPGKCASLMQGGRAQEEEISLRAGTNFALICKLQFESGVIPTESSGI